MSLERGEQWHLARTRSWWLRRGGIALIVALSLGAGSWWWLVLRSPIHQGNAALKRAYRLQRPLEERISGFDYAPLAQLRGEKVIEVDDVARARAERLLLDAVFNTPTPSALHALGRFYLTEKKFQEARDQFARALQNDPNNAQLHNDQGVVLMAQSRAATGDAESGEEIEQLASALEHFNQALKLNPTFLDAVFNRALLYWRMKLPRQAREAWQEYLKQDAASLWADDVKRNLLQSEDAQPQARQTPTQLVERLLQAKQQNDDELVWKLVNEYRDLIGSVIVHQLLDNYLTASINNEPTEAQQFWDALTYVSDLEMKLTEDHFTNDLVTFYRKVSPGKRLEAVKARGHLKEGLSRLETMRVEDAKELFAQARQRFVRIGNTIEILQADFLLARCYRQKNEVAARSQIYERLSQTCARSEYRWLLTQILMAQTFVQSSLANDSNVLEIGRRGLQISTAINDSNSSAKFLLQVAESYHNLGDYYGALKFYFQGLKLVTQPSAEPLARWAVYMSMAVPLNSIRRHAAAALYQQESLRIAEESKNEKRIGVSYVNLGVTYSYLRNHTAATQCAQQAFDLAQRAPNGVSRTELLALALLRLGQSRSQAGNFTEAIESFDQAIRLYDEVDTQEAFRYSAHKWRLLAHLAQGNSSALEEEINRVLELSEKYREKIREESNRNHFFDVEQSIYDIAIDFWYRQKNDAEAAFQLAERSRARSLLDLMSSSPRAIQNGSEPDLQYDQMSPSLSLAEIQARLPEKTQVVQYAVLKDRILIWLISRGQRPIAKEQPISEELLGKQVSAYLQLVTNEPADNEAAMAENARQLYQLLIAPIASLLDPEKTLCLVPDKILCQMPFAALIAPNSGRFLIEDYSITFAPSATMFVICSEKAVAKERGRIESLLSVGDPTFDRHRFSLPYLSSARQEAQTVASYYHHPAVFVAEQATKQRIETGIERYDVLHFALHCLVNERSPMNSKLLLAKPKSDEDDPGEADEVLQAYEIYRLPLSRLRLVVLAACRSGVERYYGGEGMVGISRPFLAKGVPLVVATLWDAYSPATLELMTRFHRNRKLGHLPTSEALRQAQLSLLREPNSAYKQPYYWATFESIGGYARF